MYNYNNTTTEILWMVKEIRRFLQAFDSETTVGELQIAIHLGELLRDERSQQKFLKAYDILTEEEQMALRNKQTSR